MSESEAGSARREIHADEEWKERVRNEDRQRDEQRSAPDEPASSTTPDRASRLPRADFSVLVQMFATQAMVALGLIAEPGADAPQRNLPLARHFIDLLGVLDEKSRGNLTPAEQQLLTTSLHELRLVFVELSKLPTGTPDATAT
jgi:hypothetical protein